MPGNRKPYGSGERRNVLRSITGPVVAAVFLCVVLFAGFSPARAENSLALRISDWKTGEIYVEKPAKVNAKLFFGWIHSLEKIPWNEYFHIGADRNLILDAITFPAFGAGIPENKGTVCYVKDGLIHMEEIGQVFPELVWLNSHTATRDIMLDGVFVTRGSDLPHHVRLRLAIIEKK
ncbi:MAG: hypothetical protein DELT_01889 [Desulfovibrio sp.]